MIVAIQGSRSFNDYSVFLRAMGTALSMMGEDDKEFFIYSTGPRQINEMALEFSNVSERGLKARGIKIRMYKVPPSWAKQNIHDINYFIYFSKPKEPVSELTDFADRKNIEVGIYRY
jgi:hypothetical protein